MSPLPSSRVCALVPAHNEAPRVGRNLQVILHSGLADRVLLIDDGSTDETRTIGERMEDVEVVSLPKNLGKAGAVQAGLSRVDAGVVLLLDADLLDLNKGHIFQLLDPVLRGHCEMSVGVFQEGRLGTDLGQFVAPGLSGQRAFQRERISHFPFSEVRGYGFETALNGFALREGWRVLRIPLPGLHQVTKERKMGMVKGFGSRMRMYFEVVRGWMGRWAPKA